MADGDQSVDDGSQREVLYDSEENEIDAEAEPEEKKFAGFGKRGRYEITYRNAQGATPLHQHDISSTNISSKALFQPINRCSILTQCCKKINSVIFLTR